jgi:hypothetical protein
MTKIHWKPNPKPGIPGVVSWIAEVGGNVILHAFSMDDAYVWDIKFLDKDDDGNLLVSTCAIASARCSTIWSAMRRATKAFELIFEPEPEPLPDDSARFDRMSARAEVLIPAVQHMLAVPGSTHQEVADTLRVHADLVEGKADPVELAGHRAMVEAVAKAFAAEGVPVTYTH